MRILIYNKYIFSLGGNHFMAKIIALFNNKGGVSKTTTTFHLGWKLAELGYKTLMYVHHLCGRQGLSCLSDLPI